MDTSSWYGTASERSVNFVECRENVSYTHTQLSLQTQFYVTTVYSIHTQSLSRCSTGLVPNVLPRRDEGSVSPVQSIKPHRILAPTQTWIRDLWGSLSRVVTTILPMHNQFWHNQAIQAIKHVLSLRSPSRNNILIGRLIHWYHHNPAIHTFETKHYKYTANDFCQ